MSGIRPPSGAPKKRLPITVNQLAVFIGNQNSVGVAIKRYPEIRAMAATWLCMNSGFVEPQS